MNTPRSICVFCGSSGRVDEAYRAAAIQTGRRIGERGFQLVYGGGRIGLMGLVADAALASGARVTGVIPRRLKEIEVGHDGLHELIVTDSMHERKQAMYDRADGFLSLPGGFGTLDETIEVATWIQLGFAAKPIVLVDIRNYWSPLLALLDHFVAQGFASPANRAVLTVAAGPEAALDRIAGAGAP